MRTSSLTALFLTGVILAAAGNAVAAGLGKLTVLSALGERLTADVELISTTPAEISSLKARIAPPQAYVHSNVPYSMTLSDLHVKVEKHANGRPYLRITSAHPYNEPYLDVMLQLNWDGGEVTREYTALINPTGYHVPPAVAAGAQHRSTRATTTAPAPMPHKRPAPQTQPRPTPAAAPPHAPGSYHVKHGDTLYGIAEATMPTEVTVDQMLIGLYRANPDAFHGNINRMKAGKILRIPSTHEIEQVSASKARREVKLQIANWHAYRNRLAAAASAKPAAAQNASGAVSGKISTKVEEAQPKGAAAPQDVVKLSKGEAPGSAAGNGETANARIQALEEEASARQKQLDEANSRIAQLEKTISDMRKLMSIKSAGMANAQQQAQQTASSTQAQPAAGAAANNATAAAAQPTAASSASSPSTPAAASAAPASTTAANSTTTTAAAAAGTTAAAGSTAEQQGATASSGSATATSSGSAAESNSASASKAAAPAASTASPAAATAEAKPAAAMATTAKESGTAASSTAHAGHAMAQGATRTAEGKSAAKAETTAAHPAPEHHAMPKPAPQPGFLRMLTDNPVYLGAAVIIILLLIYFGIRRRRGASDDGESELQPAPMLAGGAAAATTAAAFATVKDTPPAASSQPAPAPSAEPEAKPAAPAAGAISDDVDPLAEAEVYIAYGRDEQAEEILKDALVHHPERTDVQVKLLEVYAARKDKTAFETLAQKLHQSVGSGSEEWLKVAALGYTLDPTNPLFEAGKSTPSQASPPSAPDGLDFELDMPSAQTATDIQLDPAADDESVSKTGRLSAQFAAAGLELTAPHAATPDFVLPGGKPGPEDTQRIADDDEGDTNEPAPIPDFTLDSHNDASNGLDFGDSKETETADADESAKGLNLESSQLLMDEALKAARTEPLMPDFQLDLPAESAGGTSDAGSQNGGQASVPDLALDGGKNGNQPLDLALEPNAGAAGSGNGTAPTFDLSGINLEFDDDKPSAATPASAAKDGHWHDVQTKFDLAQAYQEMGDRDGAKEILREVVEEGDAEQKEQAKTLLRNLG